MKQKFIDVRTSLNGEIVENLCINNCTAQQLNAILTLATSGYEVLIVVREKEVKNVSLFNDGQDEK